MQKKLGNQKPRLDIYIAGNTEKVELLFELLEEYGMHLLEWQKLVLRRWLAEDKDGYLANTECGLSVPRQNGKTEIIVARVIYGVIFRKAVGLVTTQHQDTADVIKKRVQDFFYENDHEEIFNLLTPKFRKKPRDLDYIAFETGSTYSFKTRMRLSGLGSTNDDLINDEAADMLDVHQSTLVPTTSSAKSGNPQIIYVGTPPTAESVGAVFGRVRDNKMKGGDGSWQEWGVDKFTTKEDDKALINTNPSYGYFLLPRIIAVERGSMSQDDYNRQRLGWWSGTESKRAIAQEDWDALFTETPEFDATYRPVFAVKFSPDRSSYSLVGAKRLIDGRIHVEIIQHRPMQDGFSRLSKWLLDRWRTCSVIIIDGVTGASILYEELVQGGIPKKRIILPSMKEVVAAHQFMRDAIDKGELSHYNQPMLNSTVQVTKERSFGRYGGFGWDSMSSELSTSAIDAATYSLWGQKVHPKKAASANDSKMSNENWNKILSNL